MIDAVTNKYAKYARGIAYKNRAIYQHSDSGVFILLLTSMTVLLIDEETISDQMFVIYTYNI